MGTSGYCGKLTVRQILEREYGQELRSGQVLHHASVKSGAGSNWSQEIYVARKLSDGRVICEVVLSTYRDGETLAKVIDETMGPMAEQCPASILQLLTPTESKTANAWRTRCWTHHDKCTERRRLVQDLVPGDVATFDVSYGGCQSLRCTAILQDRKRTAVQFASLSDPTRVSCQLRHYQAHLVGRSPASVARRQEVPTTAVYGLKVGSRVSLVSDSLVLCGYAELWRNGRVEQLHLDAAVPYVVVRWPAMDTPLVVALCALERDSDYEEVAQA